MEPKYQIYSLYRVSTERQGQSGLGLEAQQQSVQQHLGRHKAQLISEFTEIESGGKNNRIELNKALALCKKEKATLIIAKLDRLTRNV
ncbi:MAG: recombinase family protein, partial [Porticoccaceae bacterium]|nr:recombinase family protein [Porticoccaceae bacterium]